MNEAIENTIEKLIEASGDVGSVAVSAYTDWYFTSAVTWFFVGVVLLILTLKKSTPDEWDVPPLLFKMVFGVIAVTLIASNIPTIISPEGVGIHAFIKDIRG